VHLGVGPSTTRKVYLVDEVHMLSAAASNALLKTLEEPPDHVVFILATTNPEKVLPTIRSRAQHFEFSLIAADELQALLADIAQREGVDADPVALSIIARQGAGSARDAESLLDQALAHGAIDAQSVGDLFGRLPFDQRTAILDAVAGEDTAGVLVALGGLIDAGYDPRRVAEDLLRAARDAFLISAGGGRVPLDLPAEEQTRLGELGRSLGNALLVRVLETLGQAVVDMRGTDAADPRLVLEIALVRLARRDAGPPVQMLVERIERLERALADAPARGNAGAPAPDVAPAASGAPGRTLGALRRAAAETAPEAPPEPAPEAAAPPESAEPTPVVDSPVEPEPEPEPEPVVEPAAAPAAPTGPVDIDDVILAWAEILPELPPATRSAAREAQPVSFEGDIITFGVPSQHLAAAKPRFKQQADAIRDALTARLGRTLRFNLVAHDGFTAAPASAAAPDVPAAPSAPTATASDAPAPSEPEPPPPVEEDHYDPSELVDAPDAGHDSVSLLAEGLGATVVEERPRD
jgi:DNA polymerase-3 subunit gamma/tau